MRKRRIEVTREVNERASRVLLSARNIRINHYACYDVKLTSHCRATGMFFLRFLVSCIEKVLLGLCIKFFALWSLCL
jgi:hypothetical protein